jgi:hypothetical protein
MKRIRGGIAQVGIIVVHGIGLSFSFITLILLGKYLISSIYILLVVSLKWLRA